jgi:hypothetical protein
MTACSDSAATAPDAAPQLDAFVVRVDAGPLTYERYEDFSRDNCDDSESLAALNLLGKWTNVTSAGEEFSSYVLLENGVHRGILGAIPADTIHIDGNNLFLHRTYNLTSMAVNLCAVVDADTLSGYLATCSGTACTETTIEATLVEPSTD